jgi:hypothetical protein
MRLACACRWGRKIRRTRGEEALFEQHRDREEKLTAQSSADHGVLGRWRELTALWRK